MINPANGAFLDDGVAFARFLWEECKPELEAADQNGIDAMWIGAVKNSPRRGFWGPEVTAEKHYENIHRKLGLFPNSIKSGDTVNAEVVKQYRKLGFGLPDDIKEKIPDIEQNAFDARFVKPTVVFHHADAPKAKKKAKTRGKKK